jgi:hypothetical protein
MGLPHGDEELFAFGRCIAWEFGSSRVGPPAKILDHTGADVTDDALRNAVLDRLDMVDLVAAQGDPDTLLPTARTELYRLAEGFRVLLDEHRPDDDGRCRGCPTTWRGRRWPCSVWASAHRKLIGHSVAQTTSQADGPDDSFGDQGTDEPEFPEPVESHPGDADTEEFARPDLSFFVPPAGGDPETDHTKIHRATVVEYSTYRS